MHPYHSDQLRLKGGTSQLQAFKDALIADTAKSEERVEVNQRHLIDKILARYSAEHTIYRELFQNSNDARAEKVSIEFVTKKEPKTLLNIFSKPHAESVIYVQ
jgi:hypothetical protein